MLFKCILKSAMFLTQLNKMLLYIFFQLSIVELSFLFILTFHFLSCFTSARPISPHQYLCIYNRYKYEYWSWQIRIITGYQRFCKWSLFHWTLGSVLFLLEHLYDLIPTQVCSRSYHSSLLYQSCFDRKYYLGGDQEGIQDLFHHKCTHMHCRLIHQEMHHW